MQREGCLVDIKCSLRPQKATSKILKGVLHQDTMDRAETLDVQYDKYHHHISGRSNGKTT